MKNDIFWFATLSLLTCNILEPEPCEDFCVPKLNLNPADYIQTIDWQPESICKPPIIQVIEGYSILVTEASASICNPGKRDGFILALKNESKIQYNVDSTTFVSTN